MTIPSFVLKAELLDDASITRIEPDPSSSQVSELHGRGFKVDMLSGEDLISVQYRAYLDGRCSTHYEVRVNGRRLWDFREETDAKLAADFRAVCANLASRKTDVDMARHDDETNRAMDAARAVFQN